MAPSTLQETVTVTGEAPLIETQSSELGGNIDPRQVSDLPSAGRNWMSLALLAPGNRTNAQGALPVQDRGDVREFQLNVDGLQVTANLGTGNQSRYSNDAIAEFQFISNRFDATQGRSSGVQVNAITKSGTNQLLRAPSSATSATAAGTRRTRCSIEGPAVQEPADQRHGRRPDHPQQAALLRQLRVRAPAAHLDLEHAVSGVQRHHDRHAHVKLSGVRLDQELSSKMRLMGKVNHSSLLEPFGAGGANHPAATASNKEHSTDVVGEFTQVLSNKALNAVASATPPTASTRRA